jgi:hypothetical protein
VLPGDELEARISQLWFWEGYFARRNINIQRFYHPEPLQVTDLDLLAFEFGPTLERRKYIGEAKAGTGRSAPAPLDRVIWLRGLLELTAAQGAELTSAIDPSPRVRNLGVSLGVMVQSVRDLERREQQIRIDEVADLGCHGVAFVSQLRRIHHRCTADVELTRAFWFLRSEVWLIDPWLAIKRTMTLMQRMAKRWVPGMDEDERLALAWILCEAVSVTTLNLVTVAHSAVRSSTEQFAEHANEKLAEGLAPRPVMMRVSDMVDKFLSGVLGPSGVPRSVVVDAMGAFVPKPPSYAESLIEVVRRLALGSANARHIPRFLDLVIFERVLRGRDPDTKAVSRLGLIKPPSLVAPGSWAHTLRVRLACRSRSSRRSPTSPPCSIQAPWTRLSPQ